MNNLIILATYWNEIDWVKPSLEQIDRLNPIEVIICDGCFDPNVPLPSTDGTREIIEAYVAGRENATMVSPLRKSLPVSVWNALRGHAKSSAANRLKPARWKGVIATLRTAAYRRNQSMTFNHMISVSNFWEPGRWFMAYDSDQFYPDEMIDRFAEIVNTESDYGLLTASEITFFEDLDHCTDAYEKRNYNNMPHRIYPTTTFIPTRGIVLEEWRNPATGGFLSKELYPNRVKSLDLGQYFHYKLTNRRRFDEGYRVGDRRKPDVSQYPMKQFDGVHPTIIRKYLEST